MSTLFEAKTLEEITDSLSKFQQQGRAMYAKDISGSVFNRYLRGLSVELKRAYDAMRDLSCDYNITQTTELIEFWESAVGIPDGCFPASGDLEERRVHVLVKFAQMNVQTADDFELLGETLGFSGLVVESLQDFALPPYDVPLIPTKGPSSRYTIVVTGTDIVGGLPPYDVPFTPVAESSSFLRCVFELVRPANCDLIFRNL